jgi:hypothetical protein
MALFFYSLLAGLTQAFSPSFVPVLITGLAFATGAARRAPRLFALMFILSFALIGSFSVGSDVVRLVGGLALVACAGLLFYRKEKNADWVSALSGVALGAAWQPTVGTVSAMTIVLSRDYLAASWLLSYAFAFGVMTAFFGARFVANAVFRKWLNTPERTRRLNVALFFLVVLTGMIAAAGADELMSAAFIPFFPFSAFAL